MRATTFSALFAAFYLSWGPAAAEAEREVFYGSWGSADQCARTLIQETGTVSYEPFIVGPDWLQHGRVYCRLSWLPIEARPDGLFTAALAQCGEDAVRDYLLTMTLSDDGMTLRWEFPVFGPLSRCAVS